MQQYSRVCCGLLASLFVILVVATTTATAAPKKQSFDDWESGSTAWSPFHFLQGAWGIRPLPVDNVISQYSHTFVAVEGKFDGVVRGSIDNRVSNMPSPLLNTFSLVSDAVAPIGALFEHKEQALAKKEMAAKMEELKKKATNSNGGGEDEVALRAAMKKLVNEKIANFQVTLELGGGDSFLDGFLTVNAYPNATAAVQDEENEIAADNNDEEEDNEEAVGDAAPSSHEKREKRDAAEAEQKRQLKEKMNKNKKELTQTITTSVAIVSLKAPFSFKYSPTTSHHLKVSHTTCDFELNTKEMNVLESVGLEKVECLAMKATAVDPGHIMMSFTVKGRTTTSSAAATTTSFSFVLKRQDVDNSPESNATIYTFVMLLVVGAVKFGPRMWLQWQGVNPDKFVKGHNRLSKMSDEERKRVLQQQYEIIQKMQAEDEAKKKLAEERAEKKE